MSRRSSTGSRPRRAKRSRSSSSSSSRSGTPGARVLHLDCFSGIAGNMFLGALLDLGLPRRELDAQLAGLGLAFTLRVRKVRRGALAARHLEVKVAAPSGRGQRHRHGRHYAEIVDLLEKARIEAAVRERALAIFEALGRAEAKVHGIELAKVHFHEVGAVDAIVDVTGAAAALELLSIDRVSASTVALGEGAVETQHGRLPLPAPATLELLRGIPTAPAHVAWETVTPTGAAILRAVVESYGPLPAMTVESVGHGAGEDRPGPMPNVLRAVLGRAAGARADRVAILETHLDDLVPEHFDYLLERLLEEGALDVSVQHLQMKKNRPGYLVRVLARPSDRLPLAHLLFAESTALGVRVNESDRLVLEREQRRVATPFGSIRVKRVWDPEGRVSASAEYDDCKAAAKKHKVPLREVVRAAEDAARGIE